MRWYNATFQQQSAFSRWLLLLPFPGQRERPHTRRGAAHNAQPHGACCTMLATATTTPTIQAPCNRACGPYITEPVGCVLVCIRALALGFACPLALALAFGLAMATDGPSLGSSETRGLKYVKVLTSPRARPTAITTRKHVYAHICLRNSPVHIYNTNHIVHYICAIYIECAASTTH